MKNNHRSVLLRTILLVFISAVYSQAATLYTSYSAGMSSPGYDSPVEGRIDANSFNLSNTSTVASVAFYALDCCGYNWSGTISYYLFTNNSYEPSSTPFAEGTVSSYIATTVYSDTATNVVTEYQFNLSTPESLAAGTYWLGIEMSTPSGGDSSGWNSCYSCGGINAYTGGSAPYGWNLNAGAGAFALYDTTFQTTPAPEPQAIGLLGLGLGLIGIAWRRRRRTTRV